MWFGHAGIFHDFMHPNMHVKDTFDSFIHLHREPAVDVILHRTDLFFECMSVFLRKAL